MKRYALDDWVYIVIGLFVLAFMAVYLFIRDLNDERVIRSMERDLHRTCRRITKVAAR